jgi:Phage tail sheath protein subtilisin-like domain/Phage tail sheath C-terminal domain
VLISTSQQAIDLFGEPFPESYLMYAVLAYLEEGNQCYIMRVGVECQEGQAAELSTICIDTSGERGVGWGRIPIFTGIDFGRINLRKVTTDDPLVFHAASTDNVIYNDAAVSSTNGETTASLAVTGTYTGDIDDSFVIVVTGAPTVSAADKINGATFDVVRNSDGEIILSGEFSDVDFNGTSQVIDLGNGLSIQVTVTDGVLDVNDTFSFEAHPNNRVFSISVDGGAANTYTMPIATYTTAAAFVTAFNALLSGEDFLAISYTLDDGVTVIPQIRTSVAGDRIQIMSTSGWAYEVGSQLYAWDIPRSYLIGTDVGPYNISAQNDRVKLNVIGDLTTQTIEFNVPRGSAQPADNITSAIDLAGVVSGMTYFESFTLTVPGGSDHVVVMTSSDHKFDTLQLMSNYSNLKTLRFAEELNIPFPYKRAYRGFSDNRVTLPSAGAVTPSTPLSCETDPLSSDCAADTAYFQNIVGWLVAPSPGTWVDNHAVTLEIFTDLVTPAGHYNITIKNNGATVDVVNDVTFDKTDDRYISNVVNPGTKYGGTSGNKFINWDERPAFLDNNPSDTVNYTVRYPSQFSLKSFSGQANGIPADPAFSSELDSVVIGNPATSTGLYAFQNPEAIDINLLCTPGFSTGAVIGTALQMCESRGDVLYVVDPPFGLRPQQIVDWHNGMLLSDLKSAINSSYGALYWGWLRIFDQFSTNEIWIPPSGHVAAVFSRTARDAEQWFAPAGLRRGRLLTALDVEYSATQGERDLLYGSGNSVNPIVKFPQDGIMIWGQRTLQRSQSALDRVNVRMLMIFIKKNLVRLLRNYIFEPNDKILWKQILATINPFLSDIQARRGLEAFSVVIDETNNTPERIDRNELWVSVFLKPTRVVEFVVLNMVVLRTGASFSAEEVLAAGGVVGLATST